MRKVTTSLLIGGLCANCACFGMDSAWNSAERTTNLLVQKVTNDKTVRKIKNEVKNNPTVRLATIGTIATVAGGILAYRYLGIKNSSVENSNLVAGFLEKGLSLVVSGASVTTCGKLVYSAYSYIKKRREKKKRNERMSELTSQMGQNQDRISELTAQVGELKNALTNALTNPLLRIENFEDIESKICSASQEQNVSDEYRKQLETLKNNTLTQFENYILGLLDFLNGLITEGNDVTTVRCLYNEFILPTIENTFKGETSQRISDACDEFQKKLKEANSQDIIENSTNEEVCNKLLNNFKEANSQIIVKNSTNREELIRENVIILMNKVIKEDLTPEKLQFCWFGYDSLKKICSDQKELLSLEQLLISETDKLKKNKPIQQRRDDIEHTQDTSIPDTVDEKFILARQQVMFEDIKRIGNAGNHISDSERSRLLKMQDENDKMFSEDLVSLYNQYNYGDKIFSNFSDIAVGIRKLLDDHISESNSNEDVSQINEQEDSQAPNQTVYSILDQNSNVSQINGQEDFQAPNQTVYSILDQNSNVSQINEQEDFQVPNQNKKLDNGGNQNQNSKLITSQK